MSDKTKMWGGGECWRGDIPGVFEPFIPASIPEKGKVIGLLNERVPEPLLEAR